MSSEFPRPWLQIKRFSGAGFTDPPLQDMRIIRAQTSYNVAGPVLWTGVRMTIEPDLSKGIQLFNARKYFEAHEAMEAVWLKAAGDRKTLLHGLIQVAAAFHHQSRGNFDGFRSLLEKGCAKLEESISWHGDVDVAGLMLQLQPWREHLRSNRGQASAAPPLPVIRRKSRRRN